MKTDIFALSTEYFIATAILFALMVLAILVGKLRGRGMKRLEQSLSYPLILAIAGIFWNLSMVNEDTIGTALFLLALVVIAWIFVLISAYVVPNVYLVTRISEGVAWNLILIAGSLALLEGILALISTFK